MVQIYRQINSGNGFLWSGFSLQAGGWSRIWLGGDAWGCRWRLLIGVSWCFWWCWRCLITELAGRCPGGYGMECWWQRLIADVAGRSRLGWLEMVSPGEMLVVHDCYVVGKCCRGRNWHCVPARIYLLCYWYYQFCGWYAQTGFRWTAKTHQWKANAFGRGGAWCFFLGQSGS